MKSTTVEYSRMKKRIMRRVYYAYSMRVATHPVMTHMVVIVTAMFLLTRLVHVAAVYRNFINVRVGEMGTYVVQTFEHIDLPTLLALGLVVVAVWSLQFKLKSIHIHTLQAV